MAHAREKAKSTVLVTKWFLAKDATTSLGELNGQSRIWLNFAWSVYE